jgi:hypothetical protein
MYRFAIVLRIKDKPIHLDAKTFNNGIMPKKDSDSSMKAFSKLPPKLVEQLLGTLASKGNNH